MIFILFIRRYWILVVIACAFYAGYYLRGLQETVRQIHAINLQNEKQQSTSIIFENTQAEILKLYSNIDTRRTYENNYNCIIPADGLQLLAEATR